MYIILYETPQAIDVRYRSRRSAHSLVGSLSVSENSDRGLDSLKAARAVYENVQSSRELIQAAGLSDPRNEQRLVQEQRRRLEENGRQTYRNDLDRITPHKFASFRKLAHRLVPFLDPSLQVTLPSPTFTDQPPSYRSHLDLLGSLSIALRIFADFRRDPPSGNLVSKAIFIVAAESPRSRLSCYVRKKMLANSLCRPSPPAIDAVCSHRSVRRRHRSLAKVSSGCGGCQQSPQSIRFSPRELPTAPGKTPAFPRSQRRGWQPAEGLAILRRQQLPRSLGWATNVIVAVQQVSP